MLADTSQWPWSAKEYHLTRSFRPPSDLARACAAAQALTCDNLPPEILLARNLRQRWMTNGQVLGDDVLSIERSAVITPFSHIRHTLFTLDALRGPHAEDVISGRNRRFKPPSHNVAPRQPARSLSPKSMRNAPERLYPMYTAWSAPRRIA